MLRKTQVKQVVWSQLCSIYGGAILGDCILKTCKTSSLERLSSFQKRDDDDDDPLRGVDVRSIKHLSSAPLPPSADLGGEVLAVAAPDHGSGAGRVVAAEDWEHLAPDRASGEEEFPFDVGACGHMG